MVVCGKKKWVGKNRENNTFIILLGSLYYFIELCVCVGQFCPGFQQCKGKGPAQYLVWGDTNIRGRPAKERAKLPSEERCSMLARSGDCVRGLWSPRHFCPRCLVSLLITRNSAQDNLITAQRGKYPTKSNGRKWQISSGAVTSALNVSQLTFWPH